MKYSLPGIAYLLAALAFSACGGGSGGTPDGAPADGNIADAGPLSTAHCTFAPLPPTGGAGGTVQAGTITAGAAERYIDLAVGSALGAYTARAGFLGMTGKVDIRRVEQSGSFNASVGYETPPKAKAVAITAGDETVVIVKADLALAFDGITYDVAENLGPAFAGKVLFATSHSHSQFAQYTADSKLGVGLGRFRRKNYDAVVGALTAAAQDAIAAQRPARVGIAHDGDFDPTDSVSRDRRGVNDVLAGGRRKDKDLFVIRVDGTDGVPIAVLAVFGMHGTVLDADNPLAETDSGGAVERALEDNFDDRVVAIHLQGAGGDVSPAGRGGVVCDGAPCYDFARVESIGRLALPIVLAAWDQAGLDMKDSVAMEMLTRSVPMGPDPQTFTIRDGALAYPQWDERLTSDGVVYNGDGTVKSPIDEFNAPAGAGLCGETTAAIFPAAEIPGAYDVCTGAAADEPPCPYRSCVKIAQAAPILSELFKLGIEAAPICASTRSVVSAWRLGEYLIVTLPGEPVTLLADKVRAFSPFTGDKTIVVGYAQGHLGYLLTVEDWLLGEYEPSINLWGPLEGEYVAERTRDIMALAVTDTREDGTAGGVDHWVTPQITDDVPPPDPAPLAGTVPATIPSEVYVRDKVALAQGQPAATVPRLTSAYFAWIGEDPQAGTPRITLQRETAPGTFTDVVRRSGRPVQDRDLLVTWTPQPLRREGSAPRTHYWAVEWQAVAVSGGVDDALDGRAGVPLGSYRFHVVGTGYTLDSNAFQVVPGNVKVLAARGGSTISAAIHYENLSGYRLLDLDVQSNREVPVKRGTVDVQLELAGGGAVSYPGVTLTGPGQIAIDAGADAPNVIAVHVTDTFGNSGTGSL